MARPTTFLLAFLIAAFMAAHRPDASAQETPPAERLSFIVMGDAPYGDEDLVMLEEALPRIKTGGYPFVIHIGDYKGGGQECTDDHDDRHRALLDDLAPLPVFYTPGDNEWTDCDRFKDADGKRYSDLDRLERVRALFFSAPVDAPADFAYRRQETLVENAAWRYGGVQFVTLHVTGTNNGRDWVTGDPLERAADAVAARDAANAEWLTEAFAAARETQALAVVIAMQGDPTDIRDKPEDVMCEGVAKSDKHKCDGFTDLRAQIRDAAIAFEKPVLVIHGDTAPFTLGQTFSGEEAPNLWRLNAAGDAGVGRTGFPYGKRDVTEVAIDPTAEEMFAAKGLLTGDAPKRR